MGNINSNYSEPNVSQQRAEEMLEKARIEGKEVSLLIKEHRIGMHSQIEELQAKAGYHRRIADIYDSISSGISDHLAGHFGMEQDDGHTDGPVAPQESKHNPFA